MYRILVVDDAAADRRLVGGLLEKESGLEVAYAENGLAALESMRQTAPDLVVTDLQMPEMDGLELVREVRARFTRVPVILITAFGSEQLAIQALEQGAASYVPKSHLAEALLDTVRQVLGHNKSDANYERLIASLQCVHFRFSLENEPAMIDPLVTLLQQMVAGRQLLDVTGEIQLGIAVEEALLNAIFHGNLQLDHDQLQQSREALLTADAPDAIGRRQAESPFCDRKVTVDIQIDEQIRISVRDEGPGFDATQVLNSPLAPDMERVSGRGLVLIRSFMDEVAYNETGNELTMIKLPAGK